MPARKARLTFRPLTAERWPDFEALFGKKGAYGGCWCMWWRVTRKAFDQQSGAGNKRAIKRIVTTGDEPGVLAYAGKSAIGWCAVGPREVYGALNRSRTLKPFDGEPVWSITCFFIDKESRGRGVMTALLDAAVKFAEKRGARFVEGYPVAPPEKRLPAAWEAYRGTVRAYEKAGFREIVRRTDRHPIMRYTIEGR